jgi:putative Ca2+/H+ antiporter (TMEM165/GDT1 family)
LVYDKPKSMEILFNSFLVVAISEIGDKTQLLSFILAARFKKPIPIIWGIFIATVLNHWLAAYLGQLSMNFIPDYLQKWILVLSFLVFGFWILIPDKEEGLKTHQGYGAFLTSFFCFFLAEMGDKTQLVTIALGAQYKNTFMVTIGSTIGMMVANVPAVLMGDKILKIIPLKIIRYLACLLFILFAVYLAMFT